MDMYWKVALKVDTEDDKGRVKSRKEEYLVKAVSPTEAEAKVHKNFSVTDFEVTGIVQTKILEVIE